MECRICKGTNLEKFLDLGHQPLADAFLTEEQLKEPEVYYPLEVYSCQDCGLAQLGYVVDPEILYGNGYPYTTGSNKEGVKHFRQLAKDVIEEFKLTEDDLVVDVGSNDGTLLKGFKGHCKILGVEPVKELAFQACNKGIQTDYMFFSSWEASHIAKWQQKAKVVTAVNVFAHVDDLHDFMKGIEALLTEDGVFIIEAPYFKNLLDGLAYDTIYHEHLSYLHIRPLSVLFDKFGMEIFRVERHVIHGGSLRYYVARKGIYLREPYYQEESLISLACNGFVDAVKKNRETLLHMLREIKRKGKRVVGVSGPAKGNTLLNYCKIGRETLDYITESSPHKIDKFTPGTHIPVVSDDKLLETNPEYALLLAWNFKDQIMGNLEEYTARGGRWIIPIPEPHIVSNDNWHKIDGL